VPGWHLAFRDVRVSPELARLDLVAEGKFLCAGSIAGELTAAAATGS